VINARSDVLDAPRRLMAENRRQQEGNRSVDDVQVGVTNATVFDRHDDLTGAGAFEFYVIDHDERSPGSLEKGGAHIPNVVVSRCTRAAVPIVGR
jgi:hypothetical protein